MSAPDADAADDGTDASSDTATRVRRALDYAFLGGLVLFGVVAAIQFYFAADRTINVWVTREFRPPFKMAFNLVVLLVVGIGVSRQVSRLTGSGGGGDAESTDAVTTVETAETADAVESTDSDADEAVDQTGVEADPTRAEANGDDAAGADPDHGRS